MMKRFLAWLLLAALSCHTLAGPIVVNGPVYNAAAGGATTLASDDFNRADGALGANWTDIDAGYSVVSNEASTASSIASSRYTGTTFPNDQFAQATIGTSVETTSDCGAGPAVRAGAGGNLIFLQANTHETRIYERVSGGYAQKGPDGPAVASSDVLYLQVVGTALTAKKNGTTIITATASGSITAGNAGIWGSDCSAGNKLDTWSGGTP